MQFRLGKKLDQKDKDLNFNSIKSEISKTLKEDEHYYNVDNAKKLAVQQCMDYENFRQLVLGADLKPVKTKELQKLTSFQPFKPNTEFKPEKLPDIIVTQNQAFEPKIVSKIDDITNFKDFKKSVDTLHREFNTELAERIVERLSYPESLNKIVSVDFDALYLIKLVKILDSKELNDVTMNLLSHISKAKNFKNIIKQMLSKSEKGLIKKIIEKNNTDNQPVQDDLINIYCN